MQLSLSDQEADWEFWSLANRQRYDIKRSLWTRTLIAVETPSATALERRVI
jgi:hypothetical protein